MSKKTWGLTANGVRARIMCDLLADRPLAVDWGAPTPGIDSAAEYQRLTSASRHRQGIELHADPLRACERRFAETLSNYLMRELDARQFDRLVVAASPRTLGDLRTAFSQKLSNCVVAECDHDYISLTDWDMIEALRCLLRH